MTIPTAGAVGWRLPPLTGLVEEGAAYAVLVGLAALNAMVNIVRVAQYGHRQRLSGNGDGT